MQVGRVIGLTHPVSFNVVIWSSFGGENWAFCVGFYVEFKVFCIGLGEFEKPVFWGENREDEDDSRAISISHVDQRN